MPKQDEVRIPLRAEERAALEELRDALECNWYLLLRYCLVSGLLDVFQEIVEPRKVVALKLEERRLARDIGMPARYFRQLRLHD